MTSVDTSPAVDNRLRFSQHQLGYAKSSFKMTVVTSLKTVEADKKPLVPPSEPTQKEDVEGQPEVEVQKIGGSLLSRRANVAKTVCIWLLAVIITAFFIMTGFFLYQELAARQAHTFHGWCRVIPTDNDDSQRRILVLDDDVERSQDNRLTFSDDSNELALDRSDLQLANIAQNMFKDSEAQMRLFFDEEFDINDYEEQIKIEVPQFGDNRPGRFFHDFKVNITGILDVASERCFVAPLDPSVVMPPTGLIDLLLRAGSGYYERAIDVIHDTMTVITPPVDNRESFGDLINSQCMSYPIYRLEKMTKPIYKRSLDMESDGNFIEFAGKGIIEWHIMNIDEAVGASGKVSA